jgi:predicted PurR-regulated permease PerM
MVKPMPSPARVDVTRIVLTILITLLLIAGSVWTLRPFLSAALWATTIVVATWPVLLAVERRLGGRRGPAAAIMTATMLVTFVGPFALATAVLLDAAVRGADLVRTVTSTGLPAAPEWLAVIPWAGPRLTAAWQGLADGGPEAVAEALRPYARVTATWVLALTGGFGIVAIHFLLTVVIAAILYCRGETAASGVLMFGRRLGADRGERVIRLAGQAVRGVALGVVVTALVQSAIAGAGLWMAGLPRPGLLLAIVFVLCIAQLGPLPVLLPAAVWLFWSGAVLLGSVLVVFTLAAAVTDNILKPVLIRRGVDLPLLLIVAGVVGGLVGFGIVGLFVGPVVLAVTYTLLEAWVREGEPHWADARQSRREDAAS